MERGEAFIGWSSLYSYYFILVLAYECLFWRRTFFCASLGDQKQKSLPLFTPSPLGAVAGHKRTMCELRIPVRVVFFSLPVRYARARQGIACSEGTHQVARFMCLYAFHLYCTMYRYDSKCVIMMLVTEGGCILARGSGSLDLNASNAHQPRHGWLHGGFSWG